ncbi:vanadium-dependent haloperoxidase [Croceivirga radicis]|uniref:vanadium-dependent haloperoxidase n=1 Tax=Croceivirga radicis TaxID=1929488 RepID=UPI000255AF25|nr:vanadium-dependent haloperoxidase [Croceivirga radicis]
MSKRREGAANARNLASSTAKNRIHPYHYSNGDEHKFRRKKVKSKDPHENKASYLMNFTKGLPHCEDTGLVDNPDHFQLLIRGIDSGDFRDFRDTPLGHVKNSLGEHYCNHDFKWKSDKANNGKNGKGVSVRAWESQSAGLSYDLEGPDAQAVTMPPHPELGSAELDAEMAEVYAQALLRDVPFNAFTVGVMGLGSGKSKEDISTNTTLDALDAQKNHVEQIKEYTDCLNTLAWFDPTVILKLNQQQAQRRRDFLQTPATAFRGITCGDDVGPYISQFLLAGNRGLHGQNSPAAGFIQYGSIDIDQRVAIAEPGKDFLTDWDEWLDAQNGADFRGFEDYLSSPLKRFINTPRDLATYVHHDALYEAYLNACLMLLAKGVPFDPGIPFQEADNRDHQQGFAHFGGPHILSLVTEVATRALKAVRFQKYNVHRRCRPEVLAARLHKLDNLKHIAPELEKMFNNIECILKKVEAKNGANNYLLPMAFCEGSPMHPAYGAGHATVAGACVTILKAFFDHKHHLSIVPEDLEDLQQETKDLLKKLKPDGDYCASNLAYVSTKNGQKLDIVPVLDNECNLTHLTVEGELNKLASNIAIGRDWAGVHYFTDYYESILMGEQIAIGILEEQKLTYTENFSMTLCKFDGTTIRI